MMHNLWTATRSVLAVVAGIVAMSFVAFAIEIPLRALTLRLFSQSFPDQAALDSHVGWMVSQSLYTLPALMLGGYVAVWLAPRRGFTHAIAMAILQERDDEHDHRQSERLAHAIAMAIVQDLLIVALIFNPPHPVPPWMWAITLVVTPAAIIYGGYLRSRSKTAAQPAERAAAPDGGSR